MELFKLQIPDSEILSYISWYDLRRLCELNIIAKNLIKVYTTKYIKYFQDNIKIGTRVDALDNYNRWYEGTVVDITDKDCRKMVRVKFDSWTDKWDRWYYPYDETHITPLHMIINEWRTELKTNDFIDVTPDDYGKILWYRGKITHIFNFKGVKILLIKYQLYKNTFILYPIDSQNIIKAGTHVRGNGYKLNIYKRS